MILHIFFFYEIHHSNNLSIFNENELDFVRSIDENDSIKIDTNILCGGHGV